MRAANLFRSGELELEYFTYGEGSEVIVCFHGFGRHASDFEVFLPLVKPGQRMITVNLFAHHGSRFPGERIESHPLTTGEWIELFTEFLAMLGVEKVHIVAYSLGGRVAMKTAELLPSRIRSLLLLAPDGFFINPLYRAIGSTWLGKKIYRRILDDPRGLFTLARWLNRARILDNSVYRFVLYQMEHREKRELVYSSWLIYRKFFPDRKKLAAHIRNGEFSFHMIFGKDDRVIRPSLGRKFMMLTGPGPYMSVIEGGHRLLNSTTVEFIRREGLWPGEN